MGRLRLKLAAGIGLAAISGQVSGFFPGVGFDFLPNLMLDTFAHRTISHADQTSQGIIAFLEEHYGSNTSLGFPSGLFRRALPRGVRSARNAIVAANEGVDQDFSFNFERFDEKDYGPAHFDNEYLEEGQNHLLKLRSEMIAMLLGDWSYEGSGSSVGRVAAVDKARVWLGRQLHTLQDFYAHSNWVEMGQTTISTVIGRPGAVPYPKTPPEAPTCTQYCINPSSLTDHSRTQYFAMHTCYRNCFRGDQTNDEVVQGRLCAISCAEPDLFCRVSDQCEGHACSNNTIEMTRVTTGYYRTAGDPNSVKPSGKCSHGGLSDRGATGIEGINKDSTLETYSPHWFLHRTAARLAIAHTKQYIFDLLEDWPSVTIGNTTYPQPKLTDRHIRLLLGLNHGSLAFVIDRSRSMATALPAIKGAIRAVVSRLQNMGYTPTRWVLVGYGQSFDTQVTATDDINVFLQALGALAVDTTNSCLQERVYEGLALASRNSLERSDIFVFTDRPADNLPNQGSAYNDAYFRLQQEADTLERTRLLNTHVIEVPNEPGYPYFEHPWEGCELTPTGTRSRDMGFLRSYVVGRAMKLRSRANMLVEMAAMVVDTIFERYDTPAEQYKDQVFATWYDERATDAATREIVADGTVDFIKIFAPDLTQDGSVNGDITVQRPDGSTVKPLEDPDVVHVNYRASDSQYVELIIPNPQPGTWKITRSAQQSLLMAELASAISVSFSFLELESGSPHGGWITKPGGWFFQPYAWYSSPVYTVKAQVDGPVRSIDAFHLRTKDSDAIIMTMNLTRVDTFQSGLDEEDDSGFGDYDYVLDQERIYMGFLNASTFPLCGDFYATVSGTDVNGEPFTRRDPLSIESGGRGPNWGRPRSPGCPPPAVPPILVAVSTFSSTSSSTTSTSAGPTIVPPVTSTSASSSSSSSVSSSSSSSSTSSESSSVSSSWSSSTSAISSSSDSSSSSISSTSGESSSLASSWLPSSTATASSPLSSSLLPSSTSGSTTSFGASSSIAAESSSLPSSWLSSSASTASSMPSSTGASSSSSGSSSSTLSESSLLSSSWLSSSTGTASSSAPSSAPSFTTIGSSSSGSSSTTSGENSTTRSALSSLPSSSITSSASSMVVSSVSISTTSSSSYITSGSSSSSLASSDIPSSSVASITSAGSSSTSSVVDSPSSVPTSSGSSRSSESSLESASGSASSSSGVSSTQVSTTSASNGPSRTTSSSAASHTSGVPSSTQTRGLSSSASTSISEGPSASTTASSSVTAIPASSGTSSSAAPTSTRKCSCRAKKRKLKQKREQDHLAGLPTPTPLLRGTPVRRGDEL